jgi:hypothetical protein
VFRLVVLPEDPTEFQALDAREHEVEQDKMKVDFLDFLERFFGVCGSRDGKAFFLEIIGNELNKIRFVIDDEDIFFVHDWLTAGANTPS